MFIAYDISLLEAHMSDSTDNPTLPDKYRGKYLFYIGDEDDNDGVITKEILEDDESIDSFDTLGKAETAVIDYLNSRPHQGLPTRIFSPDGRVVRK